MHRTYALGRLPKLALLSVLTWGLNGCVAISLANRGAPSEEMRTFEVDFAPVDLEGHTAGAHAHDHGSAIEHDHNAPDHDIDEHIAFLERQMGLETATRPAEHGVVLPYHTTVFPANGWLHGFEFEVTDGSGRALPNEVVHHFQVFVPDRRELFSPVMLRVAGAGGETDQAALPPEVGYRITEGDSVVFTAMLHNPTDELLEDVRLTIRLRYSPEGGSWRAPADVVPFFTHVTAPFEEASYDLPPGRSERTIEVHPVVSGTVLGMGGHLHRYGVSLRIEDVEAGRVVWETRAVRDPDGEVIEVPSEVLVWNGSFDLVAGRAYRVTAVYDNPTGRMIPLGGMGTIGGVIRPRGDWPTVDRTDPAYRWDLDRMLGIGGE